MTIASAKILGCFNAPQTPTCLQAAWNDIKGAVYMNWFKTLNVVVILVHYKFNSNLSEDSDLDYLVLQALTSSLIFSMDHKKMENSSHFGLTSRMHPQGK